MCTHLKIIAVVEVQQDLLHARLEGGLSEERAATASEGISLVALQHKIVRKT
jgi:hypothetical protein